METKHKLAFTLLELLVVIAIVGLLVAITVPVISKVRQSAYNAQNVQNLRTLAGAWQLYAADNGGNFPIGLNWTGAVTNPPAIAPLNYRYWWRWHGGVARYLPTVTIHDTEAKSFGGPEAPTFDSVFEGYYPPHHFQAAKEKDYKLVGYYFNRHMGLFARIRQVSVSNPSKVPLLFAYWDSSRPDKPIDGNYFASAVFQPDSFMAGATEPLSGGNHFVFVDGHVEWVPVMATAQEYADKMQWRPTN